MKHGKKPTVAQRKFLASKGINSENWLIVKDTPNETVIVHKLFENNVRRISKSSE